MTMKITVINEDFTKTAVIQKSDTGQLIEIAPVSKVDVYLHKNCYITVSEKENA